MDLIPEQFLHTILESTQYINQDFMNNINNKLSLVKNKINKLDQSILKDKNVNINILHEKLYKVKKDLLKIKIEYDEYKLSNFKNNNT